MRFDAVGLFWEESGIGPKPRPMAPIPATGWTAPRDFPNISSAVAISLDTETYDPELDTNGPGWARGVGHIVGVSIGAIDAAGNRGKWYFPLRHTVQHEDNLDPERVIPWLKSVLSTDVPKVGANLQYDVGWLRQEGVIVKGKLIDVQFAEALLNESGSVSLEAMGQKYLGEGKDSPELYKWCAESYGGSATGVQRKNIHRSPPTLVGPYAESDADIPLRLVPYLYKALNDESLYDVFDLECRLINLLVDMRFAGVRVDINAADRVRDELIKGRDEAQDQLNKIAGFTVEAGHTSASLVRALHDVGVNVPKTAKGNDSIVKPWLENIPHPIAELTLRIRLLDKMRGTFVEGYILESNINGMLYGSFNQLRGDDNGTRSGRFSSSNPNLQNIPSRDPVYGPLIRGMFVPDYDHSLWVKGDYSQIEYRFLAHFAVGPGANALREQYNADPLTDYHNRTHLLVSDVTGLDIPRKPIKAINFGFIYGMGVPKLVASTGLDTETGHMLYGAYHKATPYAKATMDACSQEVASTGIITTILGRRSRFDLWKRVGDRKSTPLPYNIALNKYGSIERDGLHKALNRRLQGSAADQMKKAMVDCYEAGLFIGPTLPRLTVHDELNWSCTGAPEELERFREINYTMANCIPLRVPVIFDWESGPDWGHVDKLSL